MLPTSGFVYADSDAIIYSVEAHFLYWPLLQPLWQAARSGLLTVISSELAIMETLVFPFRNADIVLATAFEQVFQSPEMHPIPITQAILREAAQLRANHKSLRTPDAIHAATAMLHGCAIFLTNDHGYRGIPGLPLSILDDVLALP